MTTNMQTDWRQVAAMDDDARTAWMTERGMGFQEEGPRREWQQGYIAGSLELEEDERTRLSHGMLAALLRMEDDHAKTFANDFQYVMDHGKGDAAFAMVSALHTGARGMPVEDTMRLGQVWPRIFGKDIAATV